MRTGEGMEKRLFETGDSYHICEDCGAWVPADRYKCDECGGDFSPMAPIYTFSAKDEPKAAEETVSEEPGGAKKAGTKTDEARKEPGRGTEEEFHQGQPVMRCTLCGKRFAFGPGSCPDCGGTAVPELFGERAAKEKAVSPAAERRGDDCAYCYTAYLYDDYGRRSRANHAVKLKEGDNLLGRNSFLLDPRLFFTAAELTQRIRDRYSGISRENVILTVDRDGLTVRYAGEGKAPVRINGNELPEGCSAVLEEGDLLHFGDDDREGCIEVEIGRNRAFAESRMHRTLEAIRQESQRAGSSWNESKRRLPISAGIWKRFCGDRKPCRRPCAKSQPTNCGCGRATGRRNPSGSFTRRKAAGRSANAAERAAIRRVWGP